MLTFYLKMKILRQHIFPLLLSGVFGVAQAAPLDFSPVKKHERPNIILIMADDQGWGDTGYNEHPSLKTPVLDDMARNGFVFQRFYAAAPICSPTRASVMTGRHPVRSNVLSHGHYIRGHKEDTLPRMLRDAGYVTGMFGKWHMGSAQPESPVNPGGLGFDEWVIGLNFFDQNPYLSRNGKVEHFEGKAGSVVVIDETIQFLEKHRNARKPMFAVAWFPSPHDPHPERSSRPNLYRGDKWYGYHQEITLMDEQIGRLRDWLRKEKLAENTLIWFCSDNGGLNPKTSGGRGKKGDLWEGGLRVPAIIEWPGRRLKGRSQVPAVTSDMLPTLAALVGVKPDSSRPLDGVNLAAMIEGKVSKRPPIGFWHQFAGGQATWSDRLLKQVMAHQQSGKRGPALPGRLKKNIDEFKRYAGKDLNRGKSAWLDWPWKLHRYPKGKKGHAQPVYELYNLQQDPMESNNLADQHPRQVESMQAAMQAWQESVLKSLNGKDYR